MEGFEKEDVTLGCLEKLRERIYELKETSQDHYFTEYLINLQERVIKEKHTVDLLYEELERKYRFYLERMEKQEQAEVQQIEMTAENVICGEVEIRRNEAVSAAVVERGDFVSTEGKNPRQDIPTTTRIKTQKNNEFTVGIVVFSIVGVVFLLTAFAMLGAYFMNTFAKGMSLYAMALVVCVFSELLVRKKNEKLSLVLTILGIAGIHVSTYVNTYKLFNMQETVAAILVVLTSVVAIGADKLRRKKHWQFDRISAGAYYLFVIAGCWMFAIQGINNWKFVIVIAVLTILTKLLLCNKSIRSLDAILTAVVAVFACLLSGEITGYVLIAVFFISIIFIRFWHLYYQSLITLATVLFLFLTIESEIVLTLIVAILWFFMLLFNHIKVLQGKDIGIYNCIVAIMQLLCYLSVAFMNYEEYKILYFILVFLGGGFIYFMCQERYCLPEKARGLILAVFASYMTLVVEFTYSITSSILLMIVGVASIAGGFVQQDKKTRIYGLVQALFVCFKITLFDFAGVDVLQRMILFFATGFVALIISGIYIVLEKKYIQD